MGPAEVAESGAAVVVAGGFEGVGLGDLDLGLVGEGGGGLGLGDGGGGLRLLLGQGGRGGLGLLFRQGRGGELRLSDAGGGLRLLGQGGRGEEEEQRGHQGGRGFGFGGGAHGWGRGVVYQWGNYSAFFAKSQFFFYGRRQSAQRAGGGGSFRSGIQSPTGQDFCVPCRSVSARFFGPAFAGGRGHFFAATVVASKKFRDDNNLVSRWQWFVFRKTRKRYKNAEAL